MLTNGSLQASFCLLFIFCFHIMEKPRSCTIFRRIVTKSQCAFTVEVLVNHSIISNTICKIDRKTIHYYLCGLVFLAMKFHLVLSLLNKKVSHTTDLKAIQPDAIKKKENNNNKYFGTSVYMAFVQTNRYTHNIFRVQPSVFRVTCLPFTEIHSFYRYQVQYIYNLLSFFHGKKK